MKFKEGSKLPVLETSPKPTNGNSKDHFEEMLVKYLYDNNLLTPDKLTIEPNEQIVSRKRKVASNLSYYERQMIGQIQNAMSLFEEEKTLPVRCVVTKINDSINWPVFYAKRIIKFCKRIPPFNDLTKEDQLIIIKPFYIQLLSVRCYFMFDYKQNGYYVLAVCSWAIFGNLLTNCPLSFRMKRAANQCLLVCK